MSDITQNQAHDSTRIRFLDALRGIVIGCIFIANIGFFSGYFFLSSEEQFPWAILPSDLLLDFTFFTLIDGKFYSIFSLLFGIGCSIQFQNLALQQKPFKPFFKRRLFWLLVIGLCHFCFIWIGDILTLYALTGFVLLLFVNVQDKKLLKWAVILLLFPIINHLIINQLGLNYPKKIFQINGLLVEYFGISSSERNGLKLTNMGYFIKNDSLLIFFKTNLSNTFLRIGGLLDEGRFFKVLGIFILGLWVGRKIIFENLLNNTKLLKQIALVGFCVGLPLNVLRAYIEFFHYGSDTWEFIKTIVYALGTVPLAMSYASLLALLFLKKPSLLNWFEPVGKMALTNYVSQSILAISVFYGIGLGLAGKLGYTLILGVALSIFLIQLLVSNLWLSRFKQGPLEWVWRKMTYGKGKIKL